MKILQICNHFHPCVGGIESHVEDLSKNLIILGYNSDIVCLETCSKRRKKLSGYQEYDGIKILRVPYADLKIYKIAPQVFKFVKNYDILHIHGLGFFLDFLVLTKFIHKKPLILTTHGGIFHTKNKPLLKKVYFNLWCRIALKKVDKIIAVSKNDKLLFSGITSNIELIPNAIEIEELLKIKRKVDKKVLLFVGRISKNKRIDNLIKTLHFVKKNEPEIKLYIVGEDWEGIRIDLEKLVGQKNLENNVIFTGGVSDRKELHQYYQEAGFFVSASEYEGFGISVLEAMGAGIPVIVNEIDAFSNLVRDGENGFLVDYSKNEKAAEIILKLLNNDLNKVEENAKKTAAEYDWKYIVNKIQEIYKTVG